LSDLFDVYHLGIDFFLRSKKDSRILDFLCIAIVLVAYNLFALLRVVDSSSQVRAKLATAPTAMLAQEARRGREGD
jgi:hypothetical protein